MLYVLIKGKEWQKLLRQQHNDHPEDQTDQTDQAFESPSDTQEPAASSEQNAEQMASPGISKREQDDLIAEINRQVEERLAGVKALEEEVQAKCKTELERTKLEAAEILANAEASAEQMILDAQATIEERIQAFKDEHSKRFQELEAEAIKEILAMGDARQNFFKAAEPTILEISLKLAAKIIDQQVSLDPSILQNMLREAINEVAPEEGGSTLIKLFVNPRDFELATTFAEEYSTRSGKALQLTLFSREDIAPGSCIAEGPSGTADLNFRAQLACFQEKLRLAL